jgi:hypothetical protein
VKLPAEEAAPVGVITRIAPLVACAETCAVIWESETTVKVAGTPLNVTTVAPVRRDPLIVTVVPTTPLDGRKEPTEGGGRRRVKVPPAAVQPGAVTVTGPLVAVAGTCAESLESERTANVAGTPLKETAVAPVRYDPLIVTVAPATPLDGESELTVGPRTLKLELLVAIPPGAVTAIGPLVAVAGTCAVILESETTANVADTPLKATAVAPVKYDPLSVTVEPTSPLEGESQPNDGTGSSTVKPLVAVPPGAVTVTAPLVAAAGTCAVSFVSDLTVKTAGTPLKATPVVSVRCDPLTVTVVPGSPLDGESELIAGDRTVTVKLPPLVAVPPGVVTATCPLVAVDGTLAVSFDSDLTSKDAGTPLKVTWLAFVNWEP